MARSSLRCCWLRTSRFLARPRPEVVEALASPLGPKHATETGKHPLCPRSSCRRSPIFFARVACDRMIESARSVCSVCSDGAELDGVMKGKQDEDLFIRLFALNELDSKLTAGVDWRQKLDSQRGAVLATELKNNSNKLAKWTLQAMLAGADLIKLGYVSRKNPKSNENHVLLATGVYKPREFAPLINLNIGNAWGILKAIIDLCLQLDEGKYLLLKDPNKPVVRFYAIPPDAFEEEEAAEEPEEAELDLE